eukprot:7390904-Prymnesium_polylepis.1
MHNFEAGYIWTFGSCLLSHARTPSSRNDGGSSCSAARTRKQTRSRPPCSPVTPTELEDCRSPSSSESISISAAVRPSSLRTTSLGAWPEKRVSSCLHLRSNVSNVPYIVGSRSSLKPRVRFGAGSSAAGRVFAVAHVHVLELPADAADRIDGRPLAIDLAAAGSDQGEQFFCHIFQSCLAAADVPHVLFDQLCHCPLAATTQLCRAQHSAH